MNKSSKITYCLWLNEDIEKASAFYREVFQDAVAQKAMYNPVDTPSGESGTILTTGFEVDGQRFMLLKGGATSTPNPSISFMVNCESADEVDTLWNRLIGNGKALMALGEYPFSSRYGWLEDSYGISWQLILPQNEAPQKIMPSLMFVNEVYGKAEEAITYYTSLFPEGKVGTIARYPAGMDPDQEGAIMYANFALKGQWFAAMDSAHKHAFHFNEAVSMVIHCETQDEVDCYWQALIDQGEELQCGWLKDRYGVTWQVVPDILLELVTGEDRERARRVMSAMMKMVKLDIAELEKA